MAKRHKGLYLTPKTVNGVCYWYAREPIEQFDSEKGEFATKLKWHALGIKGKGNRIHASKALKKLEFQLFAGGLKNETDLSVKSYLETYLDSIKPSVRPRTHQVYSTWLGMFAARYSRLHLADITAAAIDAWKVELAQRYRPASVNIGLRSLRTALNNAVVRGYLASSPMVGIKQAKDQTKRTFPKYITMEDFKNLVLPQVRDQRHRAAFALAMFAGLRRLEAARLRWDAIDFDNAEIRIESDEIFQTKTGRGRTVPLYLPLKDELQKLDRVSEYVLAFRPGMLPDDSALSRRWRETIRRVHKQHPSIPVIPYHGLRHSFATWLATEAELNLHAVKELLGHADIQTTMLYAHVQPKLAVEQAKKVEP